MTNRNKNLNNIFKRYKKTKESQSLSEQIYELQKEAGKELMLEILKHASLQFVDKKLDLRTYKFTITGNLLKELDIVAEEY